MRHVIFSHIASITVVITNIFELTSVCWTVAESSSSSSSSCDVGTAVGTVLIFSLSTLVEPMFTAVRLEKRSREKWLLETPASGRRSQSGRCNGHNRWCLISGSTGNRCSPVLYNAPLMWNGMYPPPLTLTRNVSCAWTLLCSSASAFCSQKY